MRWRDGRFSGVGYWALGVVDAKYRRLVQKELLEIAMFAEVT